MPTAPLAPDDQSPAAPVAPDPAPAADTTTPQLPLTAYVLLWFPLSSETFIFREIQRLLACGLPIRVYTMYGQKLKGCSDEMKQLDLPVVRFGVSATFRILSAFFRALSRNPRGVGKLMREGLLRRMRNAESLGENIWCFLAGFLLAELAMRDKVQLLHSAWGNGPATAAWTASRLTGIPFAFTGRAGDIYPQDGLLREKSRDALFIRTNNMANVDYLRQFCPPEAQDKVHCVYNGLTLNSPVVCEMPFAAPYREWRVRLRALRRRLGLEQVVDMPGFVPHDHILDFIRSHDMLVVPSVVHDNGDRDGIPNVIMEALSCAMPVVATDVCGIREVIIDGETGMLVPQRDPAALAAAVRRMLADRDAARRMAENGRQRVLHMFDSQANIQALRDLYLRAYNDWHAARPEEWFSLGGKVPTSGDASRS